MKVGYYKYELEEFETLEDDVVDVAKQYADETHEIVEESDLKFTLYVEDNLGHLHEINLYTEFDPRYEVESNKQLNHNAQE
jgi:hypothetical protein